MAKINKDLLKSWNNFKDCILSNIDKSNLNRYIFLDTLLILVYEVKNNQDKRIKELYLVYLSFFNNIDISKYYYFPVPYWYSLEEVVKYDIKNYSIFSNESLISHISNIFRNLIVFKSNKTCTNCGDDNYRVFQNYLGTKIYFCCDICLNSEDIKGNKLNLEDIKTESLIPILPSKTPQL